MHRASSCLTRTLRDQRRGLAGAQIIDIAAAAGVSRPTVWAHFPSKDDMVAEIFAGAIGAIFDLVDATDPFVRREVYVYLMRQPEGPTGGADACFAS